MVMRWASMPIRAAAEEFMAVARMALPVRVRFEKPHQGHDGHQGDGQHPKVFAGVKGGPQQVQGGPRG